MTGLKAKRLQMDKFGIQNRDITFRALCELTEAYLESAGIKNISSEIRLVYEKASGSSYFLRRDEKASPEHIRLFEDYAFKRISGVPVQYILNEAWFYGRSFYVDENVLIPRFDTEVLVEKTLKYIRRHPSEKPSVLDLCTGSGCIIITLCKEAEINAFASDISEGALEVAKKNAERHDADCRFIKSDLFENISWKFDLIVSNPPYIRTGVIDTLDKEVKDQEPLLALDGGADGLDFYRRIISGSACCLKEGGYLCLEIGYDQKEAVTGLLKEGGFSDLEIIRDLNGLDRVAAGKMSRRI